VLSRSSSVAAVAAGQLLRGSGAALGPWRGAASGSASVAGAGLGDGTDQQGGLAPGSGSRHGHAGAAGNVSQPVSDAIRRI
jgi:hypothetical protein